MDPFEVRMHFLSLLRKLNASQQSIQKVVGYALKYFSRCGEDLWDCIVEECQKGSINNRINILYFLDSLCEACLLAKSHPHNELSSSSTSTFKPNANENNSFYVDFVSRDLGKIVEHVVPEGRHGLPNLTSTKQILENWRSKRVIDPQKIDDVMTTLNARKSSLDAGDPTSTSASPASSLSRGEIFKRIEEDRERHKRLRERRWVQPVSHTPFSHTQHLAAFLPLTDDQDGAEELTLDIEFENEWDATSDWNEDDVEAATEESELCFSTRDTGQGEGEEPMDLS
ncbi:hypothetical protein SERLA73DRAFT_104838 [Serpula lacrymans var. lacrymans S7.3]|uniref:CID domain-containing protein n=2 Tax=Serpula lacrymans var. lacrymans TaxID=341189 RepID=F8PTJ2_SERL3|nr:uncharacterized protein SERLADRAFT_360559 [Serpula lacrymans var. lacrymans S7.9]EGO00520.1 hypothetical protein SERLA73DRAFT_104838 [Serpula lacrymans var. lacrymans S7.3]EGO26079.1 hypothetical protein SERLADRAFT_360559 [Serpula lacrymans var. lacrymans S7.9]